jgi:hypothetical protein
MHRQIKQIEEEPFISFTKRKELLKSMDDEEESDDDTVSEKLDELVNQITVAYIERETDLFRTQLQEKGIQEVFSVPAQVYTT